MSGTKQISVFLENRPGRLHRITSVLGESRVSIRAFSVAEAGEFGMVRVIVDDPEKAMDVLTSKGMVCRSAEVVCVEIPDRVGELSRLASLLAARSVNIDYAYAFLTTKDRAVIVLRLDDNEGGVAALGGEYRILSAEDIEAL